MVADGYYEQGRDPNQVLVLFIIEAARMLNWKLMWDPCYKSDGSGALTEVCQYSQDKYGMCYF